MVAANASPEKQLFISLITRDISLTDAVVDLTDNSVNAAMKALRNDFSTAADFHRLFARRDVKPAVTIKVTFSDEQIGVEDDAAGIDFEAAKEEVFRFGHSAHYHAGRDRLSVYGIGMKRALFKIGNRISIVSDHKSGGFSMSLNVDTWARDNNMHWTFPISERPEKPTQTGTKIVIKELREEIKRRLSDGRFATDLMEKLSKVYSYFIGRVINISVNGKEVPSAPFAIGSNFSHDKFKSDNVDCAITAGIASAPGNKFLADVAGWFVFCNFRTVIYGDKTPITGWGSTLPLFQPKHRPFLGLVTFTSPDPEALPWTTTKGSVNEDSLVWQEAKSRMTSIARPILRFLDSRYSDEGTDIDPSRVARASGSASSVFDAAVSSPRVFKAAAREAPKVIKVQYDAKKSEIDKIRKHFSRSTMSAREIGRLTFDFFLRNEVKEK